MTENRHWSETQEINSCFSAGCRARLVGGVLTRRSVGGQRRERAGGAGMGSVALQTALDKAPLPPPSAGRVLPARRGRSPAAVEGG